MTIDWEGLVVAFENRSQQITHFFDRRSGEVAQCVAGREPQRHAELVESKFHLALPKDHGERGRGEMEAFLAEIEEDRTKAELRQALESEDPAESLREALQKHAREEALFFQFKYRRARERAEMWLAENGIAFRAGRRAAAGGTRISGGRPGRPQTAIGRFPPKKNG